MRTKRDLFALLLCATVVVIAAIARAQGASATEAAAATTEPAAASPTPAPSGVEPSTAPPSPGPVSPPPPATIAPTPVARATEPSAPADERSGAKCEPCDRDSERDASEGAGAFMLGVGVFDVSSLNDRLAAHGYQTLSSTMTVIGGEGRAVFASGFVIGGRGAAILGPDGVGPGDLNTHFGGAFGMADFGFAPVHTQTVLFMLLGGIGGYGWSLGIGNDQSAKFDDVLTNPKRSSSLSNGGLLLGLTVGMDARIPIGRVERGRRGFFTIGARVGGLYGPAIGSWSLSEGDKATGAPNMNLAGAYAALALGFGGGVVRNEGVAH